MVPGFDQVARIWWKWFDPVTCIYKLRFDEDLFDL